MSLIFEIIASDFSMINNKKVFNNLNLNIDKALLYSDKLEHLLKYECVVVVKINNEIFYEDYICPLELYHQFRNWHIEICNNNIVNFEYITEDNDKNPILSFVYDNSKKSWIIDSVFKKYSEKRMFTTEEVIDFFKQFEKQLLAHVTI